MKSTKNSVQAPSQNWITEEMELASKQGIPASINGICYNSWEGSSIPILLEQGFYMEDFINDDYGNIVQVNFDRIRHLY